MVKVMRDKKTQRIQMELSKASVERLKSLKETTEAASYAEVTKNAYRLYSRMVHLHDEGNEFLIRNKNGELERIELFY